MNQSLPIPRMTGVVPSGDFKRAEGFLGLRRVIASHGAAPETLLPIFGLTAQMFDRPDNYVSYPAVIKLLEHCASELGAAHIGLEIGAHHSIDVLGPVTVLLAACRTVGEALSNIEKYIYVHSPGARVELMTQNQQAMLTYRINNPGVIACRQINEMSMATAYRVLQGLMGTRLELSEVHFVNSEPSGGDRATASFFGAPASYEQQSNALVFPKSTISLPISLDTSSTIYFAQQSLDALAPVVENDLVSQVEELILRFLPLGACSVETVAQQFGMSGRTFQHRLKDCQTDFRTLVRNQRERLALSYVGSTRTPLSHVATLLGYSDQATFTRAFSEWTGISPAKYRKQERQILASRM